MAPARSTRRRCCCRARFRDPALALYAFCRLADDAVDAAGAPRAGPWPLRTRLDRVYAGRPRNDPVERAFAAVVGDHALPRALPEALLEGFAWDEAAAATRRSTDLRAYAVRVAATVGAMMTHR